MVGVNQTAEGRKGIADMRDIEIALVLNPGRKQVLVGDEVADVAFDMVDGLGILF